MKIEINQVECKRCGHQWTPRRPVIRVCPKCHSPYFDVPKRNKPEES